MKRTILSTTRLCFLLFALVSMQMPDGIRYEKRVMEGPVIAHILEVDPKRADIAPAHAGTQVLALATTSEIARQNGAFAAINGGFFRMEGEYAGTSSGILKIAGEWLSSPRLARAAIGWNKADGKALIDRIGFRAIVKQQDALIVLDGVNQPAAKDKAILYTSTFAPTTLTPNGSIDVQLDANYQVLAASTSGRTPIPEKGYVLSFGEEHSSTPSFAEGDKLELFFQVFPFVHPEQAALWNSFSEIVGGTPLLIDDGQIVTDFSAEKTRISFLQERHPRTAIGIKADDTWLLVVIDGRLPEVSHGMTMDELAAFMLDLGCHAAMNFDGGGSSTLFLDGSVINTPSISVEDERNLGQERPVSDAILIFPRR